MDLNEREYHYPETADWGQLVDDYQTLCTLSMRFCNLIRKDAETEERLLIPGLRCALRNIAMEVR